MLRDWFEKRRFCRNAAWVGPLGGVLAGAGVGDWITGLHQGGVQGAPLLIDAVLAVVGIVAIVRSARPP